MSRKLFFLLKVLLIIGFIYWLILVSILVYLLLLFRTIESDHLCVWVGCTFVLLVVFGAVLFLGLLVVYYLRDNRTTEYWHTTPLSAFHVDFQKLVDLNTLVPLLCQKQVLYSCDLESLHSLCQQSRAIQIGRFIAILENKGKEGISKLIESLKEDDQHMGHWELAKILEQEYSLQLVGYQRAMRSGIDWA